MISLPTPQQFDIFEKVFYQLIEIPSYREYLKRMIMLAEKTDFMEAEVMLKELEIEIMERKQKGGA